MGVLNEKRCKKNNNKIFNGKTICLIKSSSVLKNNNAFPSFEYEGGSGFRTVKITLKSNQKISADAG